MKLVARNEEPNAGNNFGVHQETANDQSSGASSKRKLPRVSGLLQEEITFQRKRSATACQLCRTRKTKCNNQRPVCLKCSELNARCIYEEDQISSPSAAPANQILDRLEYLISLVESGSTRGYGVSRQSGSGVQNDQALGESDLNEEVQCTGTQEVFNTHNYTSEDMAEDIDTRVTRQAHSGSGQDILDWPVFENKYDRRWIEALIFDPTLPCDDLSGPYTSPSVTSDSTREGYEDPRQSSGTSAGICEDDVLHLVESFLVNVHVKNPIFDPEYLRRMAKVIVENGFNWKAPSCLVLIVCALASISSRFARHSTRTQDQDPNRAETSLSTTPGYQMAEAYYTAACKRIGLLKNTLLATECHFLAGVYEMYSLRPLQAAISFNRACVTFQTLTWMRSEYYATEDQLGTARASRLYWSCLKSEHETSIEIRFPSSGLTKLNYTSHFPAPPLAATAEDFYRMHNEFGTDPHVTSPARTHSEFEEGWYYYLADIAARRILQRVISSSYSTGESVWLDVSIQSLFQTAEELDRQLMEWHRTLPEIISFNLDEHAETELAYHLQARSLEIKERIYRPFLYRSIHKHRGSTEQLTLSRLVQLHAVTCSRLIHHWDVRHRHHGTWLMARQSFTSALLLLAARRSGLEAIADEQCEQSVQYTLSTLRFWEREAPDLKASRLVLENVLRHSRENRWDFHH